MRFTPSTMARTRQDILDDLFNLKIKRGYTEYQLKEYLMSPPYNYSLRNVQIYLKLLREHILEVVKTDKEMALLETIEQLKRIWSSLINQGDHRLALEYKKEISKLEGLYETQKIDITSNGQTIIPPVINLIIKDNNNLINE